MAGPLVYPPTQNGIQKTLNSSLLTGVTASAALNNVTGIQNKPGMFVVDRIDANGVSTPAKREYISFAGTSGSTVVTLVRGLAGSSDQDHTVGAIVEFIPDVVWAEAIVDALANVVDTTTLALDTTKVADASSVQTLSHKTLSAPNLVVGSDAQGDLYYRASGASLARLAKGTSGQMLVVNDSLPVWTTVRNTTYIDIADASVMGIDFSLGTKFKATIVPDATRTFAPSNATMGSVAMLRVQYASTASLTLNLFTINATLSWGASLPVPTAIMNRADVFGFACISTLPKFDGFIMSQNI